MRAENWGSFYERYNELLAFAQMQWRSGQIDLAADGVINGLAFARWLLRLEATLFFYLMGMGFGIRIILPWVRSSHKSFFSPPTEVIPTWWDSYIQPTIAILIGFGLAGVIWKFVQLSYSKIKSHRAVSGVVWKRVGVWFSAIVLGIVVFTTFYSWFVPYRSWLEAFEIISVSAGSTFLLGWFFASVVLLAFPSLSRIVPLSLGYWRAADTHDQKVVKAIVMHLHERFRPAEIAVCESLVRLRLEKHSYTGVGLEIAVGLLGAIIALIAVFPEIDFGLYMGNQDVTDLLLMALLGIFVLVWTWHLLSLRGLRGEGFHVLSLVAEACVLAQREIDSESQE